MAATQKAPTRRMHDLARAVEKLTRSEGYPPTLREVAAAIGVNTPRAHQLAHRARERGLLTFRDGSPRTLRVVEDSGRK